MGYLMYINSSNPFIIKSLLILFTIIGSGTFLEAQEVPVVVKVAGEPVQTSLIKTANVSQNIYVENGIAWTGVENLKYDDDQYAELILLPGQSSNILELASFDFIIPKGSSIDGIKVRLQGHVEGEGDVEDIFTRLLNSNGNQVGKNYANSAIYGKEWRHGESGEDYNWTYGHKADNWNYNWTSRKVTDNDFGVQLAIHNTSEDTMTVYLDFVDIKIHYLPLASICQEESLIAYIDPYKLGKSYEWQIPNGFMPMSTLDENTIAIGPQTASYGIYELCATIESYTGEITHGCLRFRYMDCNPGTIGDFVWIDSNKDGVQTIGEIGIEGAELKLYNKIGQLVDEVVTNSEGAYLFEDVEEGYYYIRQNKIDDMKPTLFNMSSSSSDNNLKDINGNWETELFYVESGKYHDDIDLGLSPDWGSISGTVWNDENENNIIDSEEPFVGDVLVVLKKDGVLQTSVTTDENGYYIFNNLSDGHYSVVFAVANNGFASPFIGIDSLLDSDVTEVFGNGSTNRYTIDGQDILGVNAGLVSVLGSIKGEVWHDINGDGIQNENNMLKDVYVTIHHDVFGIFGAVSTGDDGTYSFGNLIDGAYHIEITLPDDYHLTDYHQGLDLLINSDFHYVDGVLTSDIFNIENNVHIEDIDAGLYKFSNLGDFVWIDFDNNGLQSENEVGLAGVDVGISTLEGEILYQDVTDLTGHYSFDSIKPGQYVIGFLLPNGFSFSLPNIGQNDSVDSDVIIVENQLGGTDILSILSGTIDLTIDAAVISLGPPPNTIHGVVWNDLNADGVGTIDEIGISGVWVYLYNEEGIVDSVKTGINPIPGSYVFEDIEENDSYYIQFDLEGLGEVSPPHQGSSSDTDSDITGLNGIYTTDFITINGVDAPSAINAGIYRYGSISGYAWKDLNENNIYDEEGKGFNDIKISLLSDEGEVLNYTYAKDDIDGRSGYYIFDDLVPAEYIIKFDAPLHTSFVEFQSGVDTLDSDVNHSNGQGTTSILELFSGVNMTYIDGGMSEDPSTLGDRVWIDTNGNSEQDSDEDGLDGVIVVLYDTNNKLVATDTTHTVDGKAGYYLFENIESGSYYVNYKIDDNYQFVTANIGGNDARDSDVTNTISDGSTNIFGINPGEFDLDIDAGIYIPADLSGVVWEDSEKDGIRNQDEQLIEDVLVILHSTDGAILDSVRTLVDGSYQFKNLKAGLYTVNFIIGGSYSFTYSNIGEDKYDSDVNNLGVSTIIVIEHGISYTDLDAGVIETSSLVGTNIWNDENNNGIREPFELPMSNIKVNLYNESNELVDATYSGILGKYSFINEEEGNYYMIFEAPDDYKFVTKHVGFNQKMDSDVDSTGKTDMFVIEKGIVHRNIDVGLTSNEEELTESDSITSIIVEEEQEIVFEEQEKEDLMISMSIEPNPVSNKCNVILNSNSEFEMVDYTIFDMAGNIKQTGTTNILSSNNKLYKLTIDVSTLFSGIYYLQIRTDDELVINKVNIIKD